MAFSAEPRELTVRAILLGAILSVILAAANAYMGLYAGLTVSASIPAAVISMAILRGILKGGTRLENNVVQTIAVAAIFLDQYLKRHGSPTGQAPFRVYVMPLAIGTYLPLPVTVAIFVGGLIQKIVAPRSSSTESEDPGILVASGLIAGEALMGVIVALLIFVGLKMPYPVWGDAGSPSGFNAIVYLLLLAGFTLAVRKRKTT